MIETPIRAEISAAALRANVETIRQRLPAGTELCAAVKADAYGHGMEQVLTVLAGAQVDRVAVANLCEALQARQLGWRRPILCLGSVLFGESEAERAERAGAVLDADLNCTVSTLEEAQRLSGLAQARSRTAKVEVKVDTGMGRAGLPPDAAVELIGAVSQLPRISLEGVYSHFATADEEDLSLTHEQAARLGALREELNRRNVKVKAFHIANSAAIFHLGPPAMDLVRPGLAIYGYWTGKVAQRPAELVPALRLTGPVVALKRLPAGCGVGYGCTFRTSRDSLIGLVPIGYADGYRRALSNHAVMSLDPTRGWPRRMVPVVGRVSMDQTTIDLTEAGDVRVGDTVTIMDDDPESPHSVEALARALQTVPYEITCGLGPRVRRVLV